MEHFKNLSVFSDFIVHGITTKEHDFMHIDLNSKTFLESKKWLSDELNLEETDMFFVNQVHDKNIRIIEKRTKNDVLDFDGLMTNCKGKLLITCYADCVPLLFFDPIKVVVASIHAGWKGTLKLIGQETIRKMQDVYGSDPEDIFVGIGPSIGPCCFEVEKNVYDEFRKILPVGAFEDNEKFFVDLWNSNIEQLIKMGIKRQNIECKGICTACNSDRFFSYRHGDKDAGRFGSYIMIK